MKKITVLFIVLFTSVSAFSQQCAKSVFGCHMEKDGPFQLNEVKFNLGTAILGLFPEISYERIIGEDFSLGTSAGINMNSNDYPLNFAFIPYARWFFGGNSINLQKYGAGFFIEANGSLFSNDTSDFGAGLGLALGWKYLSRNNWVGELYLGGGRDFANDGAYPHMGLSIGRRF